MTEDEFLVLFRLLNGGRREAVTANHIYPNLWREGELDTALEALLKRELIELVPDNQYRLTKRGKRVLATIENGLLLVNVSRDLTTAVFDKKLAPEEVVALQETAPYRLALLGANSLRRWPGRRPRS